MKITIIGTGYVGLVTGACLAELGNDVFCLDLDAQKVALLNSGGIPIHEPGLEEVVARNRAAGRMTFSTDVEAAAAHGVMQFIAVGTPPDSYIRAHGADGFEQQVHEAMPLSQFLLKEVSGEHDLDTPKGRAAERFKALAEQATGGRVRVDIYPNSQLYKDKEELEALQLGAVQMLAPEPVT